MTLSAFIQVLVFSFNYSFNNDLVNGSLWLTRYKVVDTVVNSHAACYHGVYSLAQKSLINRLTTTNGDGFKTGRHCQLNSFRVCKIESYRCLQFKDMSSK